MPVLSDRSWMVMFCRLRDSLHSSFKESSISSPFPLTGGRFPNVGLSENVEFSVNPFWALTCPTHSCYGEAAAGARDGWRGCCKPPPPLRRRRGRFGYGLHYDSISLFPANIITLVPIPTIKEISRLNLNRSKTNKLITQIMSAIKTNTIAGRHVFAIALATIAAM